MQHTINYSDQCADAYPLVQQTATLQIAPQYAQTVQKMKKTSRWYLWMMNTGLLKKHLKEHYVFMNMVYHMDYVHTHALMQTIKISYMASLDLSDISDYEDYMVTSSDEEIPGKEEIPY